MKKIYINVGIILVLIGIPSSVFCQGKISAHVGASFPMFKYGSEKFVEEEGYGGAATGIMVGAKFTYTVSEKNGICLFAEADLMYNGLKKNVKDEMEISIGDSYGDGSEITYPSYLNFPLLAGAEYKFLSKKGFDLSGEFGFGVNLFKPRRLKVVAGEIEYKETYYISNKMAFKAGVNISVKDRLLIGINYMYLGEQKVYGKQIMMGTSTEFERLPVNINVLNLTLGFRF